MRFSFRIFPAHAALLLLLLLSLAASTLAADAPATETATPRAQKGVLDLRGWSPSRGVVNLAGEWDFFPGRLVTPGDGAIAAGAPGHIQVPGIWTDWTGPGSPEPLDSHGCASYRLRVLLSDAATQLGVRMQDAATAYRLFINGREVLTNGKVACEQSGHAAQFVPGAAALPAPGAEAEIIIQVSNYEHFKAGLWEEIQLGYAAEIFAARERSTWTDLVLTGALLIMGLYHLGLFLLRRKDLSSLYFGVMCLLVLARLLVTGERLAFQVFPNFPFEFGQKIEYLSVYLAVPVFTLFFHATFREEFSRYVALATVGLYAVLFVLIVVTPLFIYSRTLMIFFGSALVMAAYGIFIVCLATYHGRDGAFAAALGFIFFSATCVNDILSSENVIDTPLLLPVGLFAFIFSQSFMLSLRFSLAFKNVERLSLGLQATNKAYSRFVPTEFLNLLRKDTITDIKLGDQIQSDMTVLFSDIVAFTELSETLTPKENFDFLNSYLRRMQRPIDENGGFIDKYIGDSVMALFPRSASDAVRAAGAMQTELRDYNHHRLENGEEPIGTRIGIHTGTLMLGTIGSEDRMEGTVISDTVNLASRLEGLNRRFGTYTLISEQTLAALDDPSEFQVRRLGRVHVKGKKRTVSVFEVFNGLSPVLVEQLVDTRQTFESGLSAFERKDMDEAADYFSRVLEHHPGDEASRIYLQECRRRMELQRARLAESSEAERT